MNHTITLIFAALPLAAAWLAEPARAAAKPDILLIMPDQMRGDCLSILGHPVVRTPQFDQLAKQGSLFRRAYSTVPSCIPARFAMLTGLAPQTSGVVGFAGKEMKSPTMPAMLADSGYTTVLVGRNMHQLPACGSLGYQKIISASTYESDDDYDKALKLAAPESGGIMRLVRSLGLDFNLWPAKPWPLADHLHPTAWIAAQACAVVGGAAADQPLFLTASFYAPHPPLLPPKEYFDRYQKADLPQPAHGDWVDWNALSPTGDKGGHRILLGGETLRAAQAGYFGLIEHLDHEIAPLVAAFKERSDKAGRPWVIIVTSDHGEMLGDHGYFRKCEPYEGAANIPFIVATSATLGFKCGQRDMRVVCLEDLMPTLLDLAGVKPPERIDGISLVPALRGEPGVARDWLHFEHSPCYSRAQAFQALTDGHYKYIWRTMDGSEQLFNLDKDPREERDLAGIESESTTLATWRQRLIHRLAGRREGFSDDRNLIPIKPAPAKLPGTP